MKRKRQRGKASKRRRGLLRLLNVSGFTLGRGLGSTQRRFMGKIQTGRPSAALGLYRDKAEVLRAKKLGMTGGFDADGRSKSPLGGPEPVEGACP